MSVPVAIVGVGGYAGQQLYRCIAAHPMLSIAGVFGSESTSGRALGTIAPSLRDADLIVAETTAEALASSGAEAVFLATPHEASVGIADSALRGGLRVIDLSAAFRLANPEDYPKFYGFEHARPDLLHVAVYGLPELDRERLRSAELIAAPGCYPTSAILPLAPLIAKGTIDRSRDIVIDSTSGVSGAGRKASERTSFCEVSQSPYGVFSHRHQPEIDLYCGAATVFTPHLGPYERGICSTIHATLVDGASEATVRDILHDQYAAEPFVRLLPSGEWPSVGAVARTNFIDIAVAVRGRHLIAVSCLDNLMKGAAGQALQAFNASMGWDERLGLVPGPVG
ncbi:MAG: N-acetyl-gamma-glutamyl-phosphate reductase [Planctomycetota bacterium]